MGSNARVDSPKINKPGKHESTAAPRLLISEATAQSSPAAARMAPTSAGLRNPPTSQPRDAQGYARRERRRRGYPVSDAPPTAFRGRTQTADSTKRAAFYTSPLAKRLAQQLFERGVPFNEPTTILCRTKSAFIAYDVGRARVVQSAVVLHGRGSNVRLPDGQVTQLSLQLSTTSQ